jgi:hypothetical protein
MARDAQADQVVAATRIVFEPSLVYLPKPFCATQQVPSSSPNHQILLAPNPNSSSAGSSLELRNWSESFWQPQTPPSDRNDSIPYVRRVATISLRLVQNIPSRLNPLPFQNSQVSVFCENSSHGAPWTPASWLSSRAAVHLVCREQNCEALHFQWIGCIPAAIGAAMAPLL